MRHVHDDECFQSHPRSWLTLQAAAPWGPTTTTTTSTNQTLWNAPPHCAPAPGVDSDPPAFNPPHHHHSQAGLHPGADSPGQSISLHPRGWNEHNSGQVYYYDLNRGATPGQTLLDPERGNARPDDLNSHNGQTFLLNPEATSSGQHFLNPEGRNLLPDDSSNALESQAFLLNQASAGVILNPQRVVVYHAPLPPRQVEREVSRSAEYPRNQGGWNPRCLYLPRSRAAFRSFSGGGGGNVTNRRAFCGDGMSSWESYAVDPHTGLNQEFVREVVSAKAREEGASLPHYFMSEMWGDDGERERMGNVHQASGKTVTGVDVQDEAAREIYLYTRKNVSQNASCSESVQNVGKRRIRERAAVGGFHRGEDVKDIPRPVSLSALNSKRTSEESGREERHGVERRESGVGQSFLEGRRGLVRLAPASRTKGVHRGRLDSRGREGACGGGDRGDDWEAVVDGFSPPDSAHSSLEVSVSSSVEDRNPFSDDGDDDGEENDEEEDEDVDKYGDDDGVVNDDGEKNVDNEVTNDDDDDGEDDSDDILNAKVPSDDDGDDDEDLDTSEEHFRLDDDDPNETHPQHEEDCEDSLKLNQQSLDFSTPIQPKSNNTLGVQPVDPPNYHPEKKDGQLDVSADIGNNSVQNFDIFTVGQPCNVPRLELGGKYILAGQNTCVGANAETGFLDQPASVRPENTSFNLRVRTDSHIRGSAARDGESQCLGLQEEPGRSETMQNPGSFPCRKCDEGQNCPRQNNAAQLHQTKKCPHQHQQQHTTRLDTGNENPVFEENLLESTECHQESRTTVRSAFTATQVDQHRQPSAPRQKQLALDVPYYLKGSGFKNHPLPSPSDTTTTTPLQQGSLQEGGKKNSSDVNDDDCANLTGGGNKVSGAKRSGRRVTALSKALQRQRTETGHVMDMLRIDGSSFQAPPSSPRQGSARKSAAPVPNPPLLVFHNDTSRMRVVGSQYSASNHRPTTSPSPRQYHTHTHYPTSALVASGPPCSSQPPAPPSAGQRRQKEESP